MVLRRCVSDQDVSVRRDCVFPRVLYSRVRERIFGIGQWRLWCAVDLQGTVVRGQIELVRRVLEVFERLPTQGVMLLVGEAQGGTAGRVEISVVVSCYDVFVRVRKGGVKVDGGLKFCGSAVVGHVAGVDEYVAVRNIAWIERVGVRYADYPDWSLMSSLWAANGKEEGR